MTKAQTNKEFAASELFKKLCEERGRKLNCIIVPTARQASKFRNQRNRWAK